MKKDTSASTILVIAMGFLVVNLLFNYPWALKVSLIIGLIGVFSDSLSKKIDWAWMKLSYLLSKIFPPILIGIIFFLVLFPLSLLSKLFTKDPLMLSNKYDSYFVNVEKPFDKSSFEKLW
jgi:hypothetical protein